MQTIVSPMDILPFQTQSTNMIPENIAKLLSVLHAFCQSLPEGQTVVILLAALLELQTNNS